MNEGAIDYSLARAKTDQNAGMTEDRATHKDIKTASDGGWFQSLPNILYRFGMLFTFTMIAWNGYRYLTDAQDAAKRSGASISQEGHREALLSAGVEMQRPTAFQALFGADPGAEIPLFPSTDAATGRVITAHRPVWPSKGRFDLHIYASPDSAFSGGPREKAQLLWSERGLSYDARVQQMPFDPSVPTVHRNLSIDLQPFRYRYICNCSSDAGSGDAAGGTGSGDDDRASFHSNCPGPIVEGLLEFRHIYAHVFVVIAGVTIDKSNSKYDDNKVIHRVFRLSQYRKALEQFDYSLMRPSSEDSSGAAALESARIKRRRRRYLVPSLRGLLGLRNRSASGQSEAGDHASSIDPNGHRAADARPRRVSVYVSPRLDVRLVADLPGPFPRNQVPPAVAQHLQFNPRGDYLPIVYNNDQYQIINATTDHINVSSSFSTMSFVQWIMQVQLQSQYRMQSAITSMAYSSSSPSSTTSTSESTATTSAATQEAPSIQLVRRSSKDGHAMPSLYDIRGAEPAECSNLDSHHNPSSSSSCAAPERRCSVHLVAPASSVSASGSGAVTASVSPCAPMSVHASLAPHILYDVYGAACSPGSAAERIQLDSRDPFDSLREIFVDNNPYFLAITVFVSFLHIIFDMLAFKNDIQYWSQRRDFRGASKQSIYMSCVFRTVILLYLWDNDTSYMVLVSSAIGLAIEYWKVIRTLQWRYPPRISLRTSPPVHIETDKDGPQEGNEAAISASSSTLASCGDRTAITTTASLDSYATTHLLYVGMPLMAGYSLYSLALHTHKSFYSWALSSLVGFIYVFGFILMMPQLYINYKLKSATHMPWRSMVYKFLSTIIDDLFAFVIRMPTMHRLACFRDDLVFLVYLYQRFVLYPDSDFEKVLVSDNNKDDGSSRSARAVSVSACGLDVGASDDPEPS